MSTKDEIVDLGVLLKFIKPFDGSRDKLNSFLSNCQNAHSLANPNQKIILFKYILSQLEGKAETACSIKDFDSWEQLCEFLKTQFGERKHYAHLLADLQECRQSINEPINQYALRVETHLSKLLTEITFSNTRKSELVGRVAAMEDLALHTFLLGLSPKISNIIRSKDPRNLNKAINLATSEEKMQKLMYRRNSNNERLSISRPPHHSNIHNLNPHNQYPSDTINICRYCKIPGHTIEVCRKRAYNNNKNRGSFQPSEQPNIRFNNKPRLPHRIHYMESQNLPEISTTNDSHYSEQNPHLNT